MGGKTQRKILGIAQVQFGYVTTGDAERVGVDPVRLPVMKKRGFLEHVARGLYRVNAIPLSGLDQYMEAYLWTNRRGVISHDTALDLHDLCDVNPMKVHLTVPHGFRTAKRNPYYKLHYGPVSDGIQNFDGFPVSSPHRAIDECIDTHLGWDLIGQAIDNASKRGLIDQAQMIRLMSRRG